eukprot:4911898-Lingulodinium_polyedra.AAC.1
MGTLDKGQHIFRSAHCCHGSSMCTSHADTVETVLPEHCISTFCLMELLLRWSGSLPQQGGLRGAEERAA